MSTKYTKFKDGMISEWIGMAVCCHAYIGKKKGLDTRIMTSVCDVWSWTEFHRKSVSMMDHNKTESDGVKDLYSIPYTINMNDNTEIKERPDFD